MENITDQEYKCFIYFGEMSNSEYNMMNNYCKSKELFFFNSPVIYHLKEDYDEYRNNIIETRQNEQILSGDAVYPCQLRIYKEHIFMKGGANHIMFGVKVMKGRLLKGMPLRLHNTELMKGSEKEPILGKIISLQRNNEDVEEGKEFDNLCIRLDNPNGLLYGRHFDYNDNVYSSITRESIDILKKDYRDKMTNNDWRHVIELKKMFNIN